jgi:hypothetical protein
VATLDQLNTLFNRKLTAEDVEPWTWNFVTRGLGISATQYLGAAHLATTTTATPRSARDAARSWGLIWAVPSR